MSCWWLRMGPSHRHGGVSSGDPQKSFLGHFSTIWWFWRRGGFRREAHPGGTSFPVAPGGAGGQRILFPAGLGANGSRPTAVMSLQVSAPSTQSCAPPPGRPQGTAVGMGLSGVLFPAEPGADPTLEP